MGRAALFLLLFCASAGAQEATFTLYSPLASNAEMLRRFFSPLRAEQVRSQMGAALGAPVDLAHEEFNVVVPGAMPAKGYGLVVFVPPWNTPRMPAPWVGAMDKAGLIVVTAARSGNDQNVVARREPLALLAVVNIAARYRLDPERIYISGFSGGSRVALRLALAYPDIFKGAILDAGSDPIGTAEIPLPPRDLFTLFQTQTRLVYLTGEKDTLHIDMDRASLAAMDQWCVAHTTKIAVPGTGHEPADASLLGDALAALEAPGTQDTLASCRAAIDRAVASELDAVQAQLASGQRDAALKHLGEIDTRYGGLAAPRSVEMAARLAPER